MAGALALLSFSLLAQSTAANFKARYERQVKAVGSTGVGVETIIDNWEAAYPEDLDMLVSKFAFNLAKSQSTTLIVKDQKRYLGQKPALNLKDSLGRDVLYFEDITFVDSLFAESQKSIDKAVSLKPRELRYRLYKTSAMIAYEKESPDLAYGQISSLIDEYEGTKSSGEWTLDGKAIDSDLFCQAIGEYCYSLYSIGSPAAYEYFFGVSEKMSKLYPRNTAFIDNMGSYYQVAKDNQKQALKFYKKALKIDPEDYAATKNIALIQSLQSKKGQGSK